MKAITRLAPILLILSGVGLVACNSQPPRQSIKLTGFSKVTIFGSSGSVTIAPGRTETASILSALESLPRVKPPSCHENALLYKLTVRQQEAGKSSYVVEGWECASVISEKKDGATTWLSDRHCSLLRAVKASLPKSAGGTRAVQCVKTGPS